jgi:hypothetical protein
LVFPFLLKFGCYKWISPREVRPHHYPYGWWRAERETGIRFVWPPLPPSVPRARGKALAEGWASNSPSPVAAPCATARWYSIPGLQQPPTLLTPGGSRASYCLHGAVEDHRRRRLDRAPGCGLFFDKSMTARPQETDAQRGFFKPLTLKGELLDYGEAKRDSEARRTAQENPSSEKKKPGLVLPAFSF